MIIHNFDPIFIDLGIVQIRWYSIAYILGIVLGWIYIKKVILNYTQKNISSSSEKNFDDIIIYLISVLQSTGMQITVGGTDGWNAPWPAKRCLGAYHWILT